MTQQEEFMREAIALSAKNIEEKNWGPFGAVVVKDGQIVGRGYNHVVANNDPSAHGEIMAIRDACKNLWTFELTWCDIYTNAEPCPMCLWAIERARIHKIYYGNTMKDSDELGFDDSRFYKEFSKSCLERKVPSEQLCHDEAKKVFDEWKKEVNDIKY